MSQSPVPSLRILTDVTDQRQGAVIRMYSKSLELMELREAALAARQKAERARQLAARGGQRAGAVFEQQALELEARAAVLETRMEQFQARIKQENGATPRAAKGHR